MKANKGVGYVKSELIRRLNSEIMSCYKMIKFVNDELDSQRINHMSDYFFGVKVAYNQFKDKLIEIEKDIILICEVAKKK